MNQRRPKLGDILDDYCTRERRLTNHVIVAMVEDEVKLTRCTTCDAEHDFKHGKMPTLRRKKDAVSTAYKEVLAAVTGETTVAPPPEPEVVAAATEVRAAAVLPAGEPPASADAREAEDAVAAEPRVAGAAEEVRVHRRLIRATLPRPENHVPDRPVPEFTMHQPTDRGGKFRGGAGRGVGGRHAGGRGGGPHGGQPRGPVFGRPPGDRGGPQGGRIPGRGDAHRPHRGGQPGRPGKKHSR